MKQENQQIPTPSSSPPALPSGEFLYSSLKEIFSSDPDIDEFGLLVSAERKFYLTEEKSTRKPPAHSEPAEDTISENVLPPESSGLSLPEDDENSLGPPYFHDSHKLGIAFWAIPPLLAHTKALFQSLTKEIPEDFYEISFSSPNGPEEEEKGEKSRPFSPFLSNSLLEELFSLTRVFLLINPDQNTIWNWRKKLYYYSMRFSSSSSAALKAQRSPSVGENGQENPTKETKEEIKGNSLNNETQEGNREFSFSIADELQLLNLIFTKHPKSGEAWAHRRWALMKHNGLKRLFPNENKECSSMSPSPSPPRISSVSDPEWLILMKEIPICEAAADLYPKNYYSWSHRHWIFSFLADLNGFVEELKRLRAWTDRHVGDFSAFQHRQYILLLLAARCSKHVGMEPGQWVSISRMEPFPVVSSIPSESSASSSSPPSSFVLSDCPCCFHISSELSYLTELILLFPGHESHWQHRKFLIYHEYCCFLQHYQEIPCGEEISSSSSSSSSWWFHRYYDYFQPEWEFCEEILYEISSSSSSSSDHQKIHRFVCLHRLFLMECIVQGISKQIGNSYAPSSLSSSSSPFLSCLHALPLSEQLFYSPLLENVAKQWHFLSNSNGLWEIRRKQLKDSLGKSMNPTLKKP